jgi:hypothetical protein
MLTSGLEHLQARTRWKGTVHGYQREWDTILGLLSLALTIQTMQQQYNNRE